MLTVLAVLPFDDANPFGVVVDSPVRVSRKESMPARIRLRIRLENTQALRRYNVPARRKTLYSKHFEKRYPRSNLCPEPSETMKSADLGPKWAGI